MVMVIRDKPPHRLAIKPDMITTIMTLGLVCAVGVAMYFLFSQTENIGWPTFVFAGGMTLILLCWAYVFLLQRRRYLSGVARATHETRLFEDIFAHAAYPALVTEGNEVVAANTAYQTLAQRIGNLDNTDNVPTIDRLFSMGTSETSSSLFRLHHLRDNTQNGSDEIECIGPNGETLRYHIRTVKFDGTLKTYWEIIEIPRTDMNGRGGHDLAAAPIGLLSVDDEGKILSMNEALTRWLGVETDMEPTFLREIVSHPEIILRADKASSRIVRTDTRLITMKGIVSPIIMTGNWTELESGQTIALIAFYGHTSLNAPEKRSRPLVVDRLATADGSDANMRDEGGHHQVTGNHFMSAPIAIIRVDNISILEGNIIDENPAFERLMGGESFKGAILGELITNIESVSEDNSLNLHEQPSGLTFEASLTNQPECHVNIYAVPDPSRSDCVLIYLIDVSKRKDVQEQLAQSQKMQAIGQLAAGIAHDFNNELTVVRLYTDTLLNKHMFGDPSYSDLQTIRSTVTRAASLVKKLTTFSRKDIQRIEPLDVTEIISDMVVALKRTIGEQIKLTVRHGRNLPLIRADRTQFDSIIMNLCVNARDAMIEQGGGDIIIRSFVVDQSDPRYPDFEPAGDEPKSSVFVLIEVEDTGTGMTDDVKAKLFEPFFTTKPKEKGTGLGLATVYGSVQQSHGHLAVDSELGVGTTFRIFLPGMTEAEAAAARELLDAQPSASSSEQSSVPTRMPVDMSGEGTILFVEDQSELRFIAAKTLRQRGYTVIEAEDGEEAFEILESGEHEFNMLISDVVMPGMDGPTLLKEGRDRLKNARIIFISGYAEEQFSELLSEEPDVSFLPKPFNIPDLAARVKEQMDILKP